MTSQEILQLILLIEQGVTPILSAVAKLRGMSGMSDEELLAEAEKIDAETKQKFADFLSKLS